MEFDRFTMVLLVLRPDAPQLDDAEADALQDAHLAHLAGLRESGQMIAAGPLLGPAERTLRGLNVFACDEGEARALCEADPAVKAGRFSVTVMPWLVPAGAIVAAPARFPRSMAEVES